MTWSMWFVPPFVTSIFFTLGIITLYWSVFTWTSGIIESRQKPIDLKKAQALIGVTCTIISVFGLQLIVRDSPLAWTFTSFQLLILIFVAYFLQVWIPYWLICLAGICFMFMNGNLDQPLSWLYTIILGGFYVVAYLQSVRMWPRPFLRYIITAVLFGAVLWAPVIYRYRLGWRTYGEEIISYLILASLMYVFFTIQDRDKRIKDRLFQAANWDALTHTKNYAAYDREITYQFNRSRVLHQPLSMLMFDIDHFKQVNDNHGHLAGDAVLTQITAVVATVLRRHDEHITLFRTGGEEFNIILPDTSLAQTRVIAQDVFTAVSQTETPYNDLVLGVTISVGGTDLHPSDTNPLDFYNRVDQNLYRSKQNGRQQLTID